MTTCQTDIRSEHRLSDEAATADFARRLGPMLRPGDTVLLSGPIGAGKTHLARSLIQPLLNRPEDIPSPTFTLVQTYDTSLGELWHADLYRLTDVHEIDELGLTDAFGSAICLVEWPDRLGELVPPDALDIALRTDPGDETLRMLRLSFSDPRWLPIAEALS